MDPGLFNDEQKRLIHLINDKASQGWNTRAEEVEIIHLVLALVKVSTSPFDSERAWLHGLCKGTLNLNYGTYRKMKERNGFTQSVFHDDIQTGKPSTNAPCGGKDLDDRMEVEPANPIVGALPPVILPCAPSSELPSSQSSSRYSGLAQKRPRPSLDLSCDSSSSSSSSVTPRPLASVACMSALPPRNFMETKYGKDKIKGSFMNAYWTGETIAPHVCTSDPTWTIGLGVIQDLNRKSKREYGRLCILQCSWYPDLKEPLFITQCEQDFQETFSMAYAMVRIRSQWIRSYLGSSVTQSLTSKLKKANIYGTLNPPDTKFEGSSVGMAMVVSLCALIAEKPVKKTVAITGGIDLSGEAWDVSGLEQKCEAAKSIGCESVIVPSGNADESHGVPLIGVDDLKELLYHAIGKGEGVVDDPPMAIDDDCALGYAQALTYMVCTDRRVHEYRQSVECCAYPGTGNVLVLGQVCDHHRDAARCALGWVVDNTVKLREKLGSKLKVDLSKKLGMLDVVFNLPLLDGPKYDYHYKSAFYLAVVSMVTGWEFDKKVAIAGDVYRQGEFVNFSGVGELDMTFAWELYDDDGIRKIVLPAGNVVEAKKHLTVIKKAKKGGDLGSKAVLQRKVDVMGVKSVWDAIDVVFF